MKKSFKDKLEILRSALREVFKKPSYISLAVVVSFLIFFVSIWLSNFGLLKLTLTSKIFSLSTKFKILYTSLESIRTNFTPLSGVLIVLLAIMVGINIAMLVYYFKKKSALEKTAGTSVFGIIAGFLGIGCASCGSVLITSLIGVGATAGILRFFPLAGAEFSILGVVIVAWSTYLVAQKIHSPLACDIPMTKRLSGMFGRLKRH